MNAKYDKIIDLPHHVSKRHPHIGRASCAAQFSPFAALTGYDDIVAETARLTDHKAELCEAETERLNAKLQILIDRAKESPEVTVTYFVNDVKKAGGAYVRKTACIDRIDGVERVVYFKDGSGLPMDDIFGIEGEIFSDIDKRDYGA